MYERGKGTIVAAGRGIGGDGGGGEPEGLELGAAITGTRLVLEPRSARPSVVLWSGRLSGARGAG